MGSRLGSRLGVHIGGPGFVGTPQREVGGEYLRMRMHLFEKCYMHAILHGLHAWHITGEEVQAVERVQSNYLKVILELPTSTPSAALFMETGICPATKRM